MMPSTHQTTTFDWFVALGSNLGDGRAQLRAARGSLSAQTELVKASPVYESAPMYEPDQPRFYNAVVHVRTDLRADRLLEVLQTIEREHGRERNKAHRFGPRTLDLDIVAGYRGQSPIMEQSKTLQIPHCRMHERRFVLQPLADVAPDWRHPLLAQSIQDLLEIAATDDTLRVVYQDEEWT